MRGIPGVLRAVCAISMMSLFVATLVPSVGADASDGDEPEAEETYGPDLPPVNEEEVRSVMENLDVSENEAKLRLALMQATEALRQELASRYGDAYAGTWYEPGPPWRIAVGLTRDVDAIIDDVAEDFPRPRLLVGIQQDHTLTHLEAVQGRASEERHALQDEGIDLQAVFVDHEENVVVLQVPERTDRDEERAREFLGSEAVVLRLPSGPPPTFGACGWLQCSALRGGMMVATTSAGGGNECSLGYGAKSQSDGAPYVITAAHCVGGTGGHTGYDLYANKDGVGWQLIGTQHNGQLGGEIDAAIVHEATSNWSVNPYLIHSSSSTSYSISSVYQGTSLTTTDVICGSGHVSTGPDCQNVINGSWNGTVDGIWFNNVFQYGQCGADGDSGGPTYANNGAYGVHFAHNVCGSGSFGLSSYATNVESILNVSICTTSTC